MNVEKFYIDEVPIEMSSYSEVYNTCYDIRISENSYIVTTEAIRSEQGYGIIIYLSNVLASNPGISSQEVEIIKKAIAQRAENKGLFLRFQ